MNPTIFMAWLSHPADGGYWTDQARDTQDFRDWSKHAPLHLSFHTSEDGARATLTAVCRAEWDGAELSYAHGPWGANPETTDEQMVTYMVRHAGYEAHVTEQTVQFAPTSGVVETVAHTVAVRDQ